MNGGSMKLKITVAITAKRLPLLFGYLSKDRYFFNELSEAVKVIVQLFRRGFFLFGAFRKRGYGYDVLENLMNFF